MNKLLFILCMVLTGIAVAKYSEDSKKNIGRQQVEQPSTHGSYGVPDVVLIQTTPTRKLQNAGALPWKYIDDDGNIQIGGYIYFPDDGYDPGLVKPYLVY